MVYFDGGCQARSHDASRRSARLGRARPRSPRRLVLAGGVAVATTSPQKSRTAPKTRVSFQFAGRPRIPDAAIPIRSGPADPKGGTIRSRRVSSPLLWVSARTLARSTKPAVCSHGEISADFPSSPCTETKPCCSRLAQSWAALPVRHDTASAISCASTATTTARAFRTSSLGTMHSSKNRPSTRRALIRRDARVFSRFG